MDDEKGIIERFDQIGLIGTVDAELLDFYRESLKNMRIALLIFNGKGEIVLTTETAQLLLGYSEAEFRNMKFSDLIKYRRKFNGFNRQGKFEGVIKIKHGEGTYIPVNIKIYSFESTSGKGRRRYYYQLIINRFFPVEYMDAIRTATIRAKEALANIRMITKDLSDANDDG